MTEKQPLLSQPKAEPSFPVMSLPPSTEGVPQGLEYLTQVDQLLVHQLVQIVQVLTGFETENKYVIKNSMGQQVYYAAEMSDCCERQFCGPKRSFSMSIVDNLGREVIHLERPFRCGGCLCPCSLNVLEVQAPAGTVIGYVNEKYTCFNPQFHVSDATGSQQMFIQGPCWYCKCCSDVDYQILNQENGVQVGTLTSQWSGFCQETFTGTGNFSVTFPMDLTWQMKATLLSAAFLVDFMYYEQNKKRK
ncbi:phospholipid scramblase 1-like [Corticium candelabrum]|uniref:phospholipid scramblase 1-like n=1 Tax=Corticium candelabrum TaxID=121492 RepID=UPI002E26B032|nr:phospholipid scramblase 1-like [Corticium candelabrum]